MELSSLNNEEKTHQHDYYNCVDSDSISVDTAYNIVLDYFQEKKTIQLPLIESVDLVLAKDIFSPFDFPQFNSSAMDGYALKSSDTQGASRSSPNYFNVIEDIHAGSKSKVEVISGTAVRITTGAPIPKGADCVIPFENTDETIEETNNSIGIFQEGFPGMDFRPAGESLKNKALVLKKGQVISPYEIGVLAALGFDKAPVYKQPKIGIFSTGDELLEVGERYQSNKIYDSNSPSISTLIKLNGGIVVNLGIAKDNEEEIFKKLSVRKDLDFIVSTAGASKGNYDFIRKILEKKGEIYFSSIKMKPGKPVVFGSLNIDDQNSVPYLGLPGNSVSAMVVFEELVRPVILKILGKTNLRRKSIKALMEDPIVNLDGRRVYSRVKIIQRNNKYYAALTGPQGSNLVTSLSIADGFAICPENQEKINVGEVVSVKMLKSLEEIEGYGC